MKLDLSIPNAEVVRPATGPKGSDEMVLTDRVLSACGLAAFWTHRLVIRLVLLWPVILTAFLRVRDTRALDASTFGPDSLRRNPPGGAGIPGAPLGAVGIVVAGVALAWLLPSAAGLASVAAVVLGAVLGAVILVGWRSGYLTFRPGRVIAIPRGTMANAEIVPVRVTGALPGPRAMAPVAGDAVVRAMPAFARDAKGRPESPRLLRRERAVIGVVGRDGRALGLSPRRSEGVLAIVSRDGRAGDVLAKDTIASAVPGTTRRFRGDEPALLLERRRRAGSRLLLSFETEQQRGQAVASEPHTAK